MGLPIEGTPSGRGASAACSTSTSEQGPSSCSPCPGEGSEGVGPGLPRSASFSGEGMHGGLHSSVVGFVVKNSNPCSAGSFWFGFPASVSPPTDGRSLVQQSQALPEEGERSGVGDRDSAQGPLNLLHPLPPPRPHPPPW